MLPGGKSPSVDFSHSKTSGFHGSSRSRGLIPETELSATRLLPPPSRTTDIPEKPRLGGRRTLQESMRFSRGRQRTDR
jgi:hypothetical protein